MISEQVIEEILAQKSAPAHITKPEELNAEKRQQRAEAARYLAVHKTILQFSAGEGQLAQQVYAKFNPRALVLVDEDANALQKARLNLGQICRCRKFFYPMTAEDFIQKHLREHKDLTLVDFDESLPTIIQSFFASTRVMHPMIVSLTINPSSGDMVMKNLGARRRFKSWRINRAFGGRAVYAAFLLRPYPRI
jgi:hypothetical protein